VFEKSSFDFKKFLDKYGNEAIAIDVAIIVFGQS